MKSEHKVLHDKIDRFLATRISTDDSGWAKVKDGEMNELGTIFEEILSYKYEEDADGDLPIDLMMVDRNRGRFILSGFENVTPYDEKDNDQAHDIFIALLRALNSITKQVQLFFRFDFEISVVAKRKD